MNQSDSKVIARVERRVIPTYPTLAADPNPMFFETRNIQGSRGNIYPHPFTDQLSSQKVDQEYTAVVVENEYIQMVMLPEIGGRIFIGLDKTNGYDFFYRHTVIKPALIGLFGPWISGGVEFNWPQHHRPGTYDPTSFAIEEHEDGSITAWMGEHEALNRTKGMVGICLHPGKAYVETKVRLYNRTPTPQTYLWWANAGVHINDQYQVIFPPDVHHVVHHVKAPVNGWPVAKGPYTFGNDYGDGTDISYWVNSPNAVSFFAGESKYEYFAGYDHQANAGVVHFADAGISPGKKYFAWANGPFGHQWQKNLMDDTGEYLELMAGVYTDNQPDFSWIMPYETKTFSQFWYPIQRTGGIKNGNLKAAVNLDFANGGAHLAAYALAETPAARVTLEAEGKTLLSETVDLGPGKTFSRTLELPAGLPETACLLRVLDSAGAELISYRPEAPWDGSLPEPFKASRKPDEISSVEELYLEGLHLEQYRHPTLSPDIYWQEALRRDSHDARTNLEVGKIALRRTDYAKAEAHFRAAVSRLTARNLNPYDGEAHYNLGLTLRAQNNLEGAYAAFYKASWNYGWKAAAYYALAQIDSLRGEWAKALDHLDRALDVNTAALQPRNLKAAVLRRSGRCADAAALALETSSLDRLDAWSRNELLLSALRCGEDIISSRRRTELEAILAGDVQTYLDIAFDYSGAGLWQEAYDLLEPLALGHQTYPITAYTLAWLCRRLERTADAAGWYQRAAQTAPDYCFPWRPEELVVLRAALEFNPRDARAAYYLGNLLYEKKHYREGITLWEQAVEIDPSLSIAWRNLGLAAYNLDKDIDGALGLYARSLQVNPREARTLLEQDNLLRRKGVSPEERLHILENLPDLVEQRDDLSVTRMALLNLLGRPQETLAILARRTFHAWEGGEGSVVGQYVGAHWILGREALERGDARLAREHFLQGTKFPETLGENPGLWITAPLVYNLGLAEEALGNHQAAVDAFTAVIPLAGKTDYPGIFRGLALLRLGREEEGKKLLGEILAHAQALVQTRPEPNFFYSGHPSPIFEEDPAPALQWAARLTAALAQLGLGNLEQARKDLTAVLAYDPSNLFAHEELKRLP